MADRRAPEPFRGFGSKAKPAAWIAGLALVTGLSLLMSPLGNGLRRLSYDLTLAFQPAVQIDEAAILYIDDTSMRSLGQEYRQPLDRRRLAQFLDRATADEARAVVLDILLDQPGPDPSADLELARALRANARVVLAGNVDESGSYGDLRNVKEIPPLPLFQTNALATGLARIHRDTDGTPRRLYLGHPDLPTLSNSLSWAAATAVGVSNRLHVLGNRSACWVRYYGPPSVTIPSASYHRAFDTNDLRSAFLRGRVIFVGAKIAAGFAGESRDEFRHPRGTSAEPYSSGVEIHATQFLNLLRRDWLMETSPSSEAIMVVLLGLLCGLGTALLRPAVATLLALSGVILLAWLGWLLARHFNTWTPWGIGAVEIAIALIARAVLDSPGLAERERGSEPVSANRAFGERAGPQPSPGAPGAQEETVTAMPGDTRGIRPSPGLRIADHELIRPIGQGSYGEVWLARSIARTYRALKIVTLASGSRAALDREFNGIRRYEPFSRRHEGLVDILHLGKSTDSESFFYVMELADDANGADPIETESYAPRTLRTGISTKGPLPFQEGILVGIQLASALQFLHSAGLVHRDLKPSNIIYVGGHPKLADLGTAGWIDEAQTIVGTEGYMAPEGSGRAPSDIFGLGRTLLEALTGLPPREHPHWLAASGSNTPAWELLRNVILKATHADTVLRYSTAAELKRDLEEIADVLSRGSGSRH